MLTIRSFVSVLFFYQLIYLALEIYVRILYIIYRTSVRIKLLGDIILKKYKIKVESTNELSERDLVTFNSSDMYDVVTMIRCDNGQSIVIKSLSDSSIVFEEIKEG